MSAPDYSRCRVLLFRGRGRISTLIRWQTRGGYSHAAVLLPDGETIIEAWQGDGVRMKRIDDWEGVTAFAVPSATDAQWAKVISGMVAELGQGYDYWAIARFVSRRHMPANDDWFCSELVEKKFEDAGVPLLARVEASRVSPALLGYSPLLVERAAVGAGTP